MQYSVMYVWCVCLKGRKAISIDKHPFGVTERKGLSEISHIGWCTLVLVKLLMTKAHWSKDTRISDYAQTLNHSRETSATRGGPSDGLVMHSELVDQVKFCYYCQRGNNVKNTFTESSASDTKQLQQEGTQSFSVLSMM